MGLLSLFFNRWLLELILIIVAAFFALQLVGGFISFASGLSPIALAALTLLILSAFTALSMRIERLRSLSSSMKLLCFAVVPSILMLEAIASISVPSPLGIVLEVTAPPIPYVAYFAYWKKLWVWTDPSSPRGIQRRYRRLSKNDLTPKGVESGHVVFSAGRRGFRVLKFIEFKEQQAHLGAGRTRFRSICSATAKILASQLTTTKKLGIEVSYELYCQEGTTRMIVGSICEGRDYRRCRLILDEFTRILSQDPRLSQTSALHSAHVDDSNNAERVLMMPLFTTLETLGRIDYNEYNAKLTSNSDLDGTTRLRMIRLSNLPSTDTNNGVSLLDELLGAALSHNQSRNFACILHAKTLPDYTLKKEMKKGEEAYQSAMAQVIEGVNGGARADKDLAKRLFIKHDKRIADATRLANEVRIKLQRLRDAENSGYFAVSITLIAEPATVENIARRVKTKISSCTPNAELSVGRLPPTMLQAAVRREFEIPSDKLNGQEVISLMTAPEETTRHQITKDGSASLNAPDACITEKTVQ